ncbi:2-amino-3,7-dideoxy-D-threo-hept-6-ulosonate synthase [Oleidesulfovibrio sp.]|uniref:2-amino-3,7-dideoxy-D-threo-hept-6-ulosonate synthase n=1 Tax=Oleidesulfovibrio sp. TaxID=2909707 RepID=UPI003A852658
MHIGKSIRMERIFNRTTNRTIVVPLDHGVSVGPIDGLVDMRHTVNQVAEGGADAVLMHKGLVRCGHREGGRDVGLIVHLSGSTGISPIPNSKTLCASVEDAIKHGADGISVHVNLGDMNEREMLGDLGRVSAIAAEWGMPLLAMMYARGPEVKDPYDGKVVAHCARVAVELGADVVKVPYTGDMDSFAHVVEACCVPVVIAGGPKLDSTRSLLQIVHDSIRAGGAGLSIGRNIFQHERPRELVKALRGLVHEDWDVEQALETVGEA